MRIVRSAGERLGGCHCGAVRFAVDLPEGWTALMCNCTICSMKGNVMIDVPLAALRVIQGEDRLGRYRFNTGVAEHRFCTVCGIQLFHKLRSEPDKYGVNAVCLDGIGRYDFDELPVYDGQNHPGDTGTGPRWAGRLLYESAAPE